MSGPSYSKNRMRSHDEWYLDGDVKRNDINLFSDRAEKVAKVALGTDTGAGGMLAWQNPESAAILVTRVTLRITTPATGVANVDVGSAADGTTSSDNLLDGQDIGTAAGIFDNIDDQGTNGQATVELDAAGGTTDYITASASADPAGLEGTAYIHYVTV